VPIVDTIYISRLLVVDNQVFGAYGFDIVDGSRVVIHADAVILATGGHTRIWRQTSSRRDENTGDSFRLAALAGARIRDAELVQFHPSGILEPADAAGLLISEAARGEGGILRNALGERFMSRYDPQRMELSTRDRVALAISTEISEGRGTANGGVLLDLTHLDRDVILTRLPRVYRNMLDLQMLDMTKDPIEIAPTAHYSMGGVWVRPEDHGTDVAGLYAIGEASSGTHGANRLGGNSLAELLVYGRIVGEAAAVYSRGLLAQTRSAEAVATAREEIDTLLAGRGFDNVRSMQRAIRNLMSEHAGVVRDENGLNQGLAELDAVEARLPDLRSPQPLRLPEPRSGFEGEHGVVADRWADPGASTGYPCGDRTPDPHRRGNCRRQTHRIVPSVPASRNGRETSRRIRPPCHLSSCRVAT
jgi:succinate dehydrogenase / fumarate reductase flavoprotein subunit